MKARNVLRSVVIVVTGLIVSAWPITASADSTDSSLPLLQPTLDERAAGFMKRATPEMVELYGGAIDELRESEILERALNVGDTAADFALPNATGDTVTLASITQSGPVVITWYRGGWCPYCNLTLAAWSEALPAVEAAGAKFVAISPELPDKSLSTKEKHELKFAVLSDRDNRVAHQYNIVFTLPEKVAESYGGFFSFSEFYGNETSELPLSATYIIDSDRVVRYAFLNADYKKRAEPSTVIAKLQKMKNE